MLALHSWLLGIHQAYVYRHGMSEALSDQPKRKAMFLGPEALHNLARTSARRRTERQAVEEGLELLAQRDAQLDALAEFVDWAHANWGPPSHEDRAQADQLWARAK